MSDKRLLEMAAKADLGHAGMECVPFGGGVVSVSTLEAFAQLVAEDEREEMAKLCDKMALYAPYVEEQSACEDCAAAIRQRGKP